MAKTNQPISLPEGVTLTQGKGKLVVTGPKGSLKQSIPLDETASARGLIRALTLNLIRGVTEGYAKRLELHGAGYRARIEDNRLVLAIGFSHPVTIEPPPGITFAVEENTKIAVRGIDKQLVGEVAAQIRRVRPPEPYKGKGVRYEGERVKHKVGKTAKVVTPGTGGGGA